MKMPILNTTILLAGSLLVRPLAVNQVHVGSNPSLPAIVSPSSSGQDVGFSSRKREFDSLWGYHLSGCSLVWLRHMLWAHGIEGSNPSTPTMLGCSSISRASVRGTEGSGSITYHPNHFRKRWI